jgi:hypothetical protein
MSLAALPLLANDAKDAGTEEARATTAADKPIPITTKSESAVIESEMQDLRSLVEEQRQELEAQRAAIKALEEKLGTTPSEPVNTLVPASAATSAVTPAAEIGVTPRTLSTAAAFPAQGAAEEKPSPLYFKIGTAEFYPLGFMDATSIFRTTNMTTQGGGSIGTSFGSIPFSNTVLGRDTEEKFSTQNSRIGLRVHAKAGGGDITGYLEADFLGYLPPSGNVTSNSDSLRMRLYWADYKRGKIEVLGGQSWSLLTPNRVGLSAMPGDLFYGQEMDTNYLLGLTWARQTGIRVIAHPNNNWAIGVSLENPQQLLPSTVSLPSSVPGQFNTPTSYTYTCANQTSPAAITCPAGQSTITILNSSPNVYGNQFDTNSGNTASVNGVSNTSIPNLAPDVIVKTAFDADPDGHHVHFDVAGLLRSFKALNLVPPGVDGVGAGSTTTSASGTTIANSVYSTIHGAGVAATFNVELVKNLRFIVTSYYSYAGGRYIANTSGPDLIIRPDGHLSGIHSGSGIGGFEYQITPKFLLDGYYSGAYFGRNVGLIGTSSYSGYGYPGSNNSSDRYLFEPTAGFVETLWRNANYGDMKIITQYSYVSRTPWYVAAGQPATAHTSMVYIDLRYDLP